MKTSKIISVLVVVCMLLLFNKTYAYTVNIDNVRAKNGKEFTVKVSVDEDTKLASGHIKFDSSKIEFVKSIQENMQCNIASDGNVAWVYVNAFGEGVKSFEFEFRSKSNKSSTMSFEELEFIGKDGKEYNNSNITGNTSIKVNKDNFIPIYVMIAAVVVVVILRKIKAKK